MAVQTVETIKRNYQIFKDGEYLFSQHIKLI